MRVSIIIPTYNRPSDLEMCLRSILNQTLLPTEILVVDNAMSTPTKDLIDRIQKGIDPQVCTIIYILNNVNSLSVARNIGFDHAAGEIILFLDDDVVLDQHYVHKIVEVYKNNPEAKGVQGYIEPESRGFIREIVFKSFYWYHLEKDLCRVLPSISSTYPVNLQSIISCEWLSGANHSYRREILEEFRYDEKLLKYCDGEDLDVSYRVFKKYPGSLLITPKAKLMHNTSITGRAMGKELVTMQEVYGLYLFYKLFDQSLSHKLIYCWSRTGRLLISIMRAAIRRKPGSWSEIKYLINSYIICIKHNKDIKNGNIQFFNSSLK